MTIRKRLTTWYAATMFVSLMTMGILAYYKFVYSPHNQAPHGLEAAEVAAEEDVDFRQVITIVFWSCLPAGLMALTGGWLMIRRSLAPVEALTLAVENLTERDLAARLPRTGNGDELDRLTDVFNGMTDRLDRSFHRIQEFTLHASHELKTPLTILHAQLETLLNKRHLTDDVRDLLNNHMDEIQRLAKIVDGLSLLTKADAGQIALDREMVRMDELVLEAFEDAQVLARPTGVNVVLRNCDEASLPGDRHRLRQLLLNLTDNSIKYNHPNGSVELGLWRKSGEVLFEIRNTGPGIPQELLSRVFDRFFRADPAHSSRVEGCGLGLSIAQWVVQAHGGTIQLTSTPNKETTATVRLQLAAESQKGSAPGHSLPGNPHTLERQQLTK